MQARAVYFFSACISCFDEKKNQGGSNSCGQPGSFYCGFSSIRRKAYYELRASALASYPPALYYLGHMFFEALYPIRVPQPKRGVRLFHKAAQAGNCDAQYDLGNAYFKGEGVLQNDTTAAYWYKKAAENEHPKAQNDYAFCLLHGYGVEKDEFQAIQWLKKAAEQGSRDACLTLASCYNNGIGVEKDIRQSDYWFNEAENHTDNIQLSR